MPLRFTLRQLEYFAAVGEAGSIAAAAERISVSASSISAAISQLEEEFGIQLFVRQHAQGLSLTPGGQRFFRAVKALLDDAGSLHGIASDIAEQVRGPITIGCLVTLAPFVLPALRKRFEDGHPTVSVRQMEAHQLDLFGLLRRAEIDVALTYDLDVPQDISFSPLAEWPPHALLAAGHPLAKRRSVALQLLAPEPLILLDLPLSRDYFMSLFQQHGLRPLVAERVGHLPMVQTMVANGFGYSILNVPPMSDRAPDGRPLVYVPIKGTLRPLKLGLIAMRGERKTRVVTAFEEQARSSLAAVKRPESASSERNG